MPSIRKCVLLTTKFGDCNLYSFNGLSDPGEHVALLFENHQDPCLVRIHSACITGELFGSNFCDCGEQLTESLERIAQEGGVLIYLFQEGRGIGLYNKIEAYSLQSQGYDTFEANQILGFPDDPRDYTVAAEMLHSLRINNINLLSNNPEKKRQLEENGITVLKQSFTGCYCKRENRHYLIDKIRKAGHFFQEIK